MSYLGRALGEFGSEAGQAHDIGLDWRAREQQLRLNALKSMAERIMLPLQIKEIQARLNEFNRPKSAGIITTPSGETAGVSFSPEGKFTKQTLVPGVSPEQGKAQLDALIGSLPDDKKAEGKAIGDYWASRGDYDTAIKAVSGLIPKAETRPFSPEQQYIEQLEKDLNRPLTPAERVKAHREFTPFGAERLAVLLSGLNERKTQDLLTDVDKLERQIKPYEHLIRISGDVGDYVSKPTGLGDVSLMNAYIEATRPDKGFRYVTTELNFIRGARGVMDAAAARVQQGYTGTLFGPTGSDQRRVMGEIVKKAAKQSEQLRQNTINRYTAVRPELKSLLESADTGTLPESDTDSTVPPPPQGATIIK